MAKKNSSTPAINWIKLGNVSSRSADLHKFVDNWIEHNEEIQILKRVTVEPSTLIPPKKQATEVHTFVVKWRKALQQYKGKWQWRDVESYLYIEKTPVATPTPAKPVSVSTVATNQAQPNSQVVATGAVDGTPKVNAPVDKSVVPAEKQVPDEAKAVGKPSAPKPKKSVPSAQAKRDKIQPQQQSGQHELKHAVSSSRHDRGSQRVEKQKAVRPDHRSQPHSEPTTATVTKGVQQPRPEHQGRAAYTEHRAPVILDGLATKQQGVYGRRHLGMKITKSN